MVLDAQACYRALKARDARFDGRFFVAVKSTRIYCRPICTVKTPMEKSCAFSASAASAEAAGYRPCLRCRPELAPGNAGVDAVKRLAQAAASAIEDDSLNGDGLRGVAVALGVTDRHLRRVFHGEFGVSPVQYAQTQRLLLAKRLLTDTALPVTDVAFASGFSSVRRFNTVFKQRYRLNPGRLRKVAVADAGQPASDVMQFELAYRPPYDWPVLLAFLSLRAIEGVEMVTPRAYRRSVCIVRAGREHTGWIEIVPAPAKPAVRVRISSSLVGAIPAVLAKVKQLLDLAANPSEIAAVLGPLAAKRPGLRVPGAVDGFEVAVRAILGQQISVKAARRLAGRFAGVFGTPVETPFEGVTHIFPRAAGIAEIDAARIAGLGVVSSRARSIVAFARALSEGSLSLSAGSDATATIAALRELPGVGEWTAQYIAMRAMAWPDAFPHTDLGVMRALNERNPRRVLAIGEAWRPWRAYAVMHLWHCNS